MTKLELLRQVRQSIASTPMTLIETETGFELKYDLANAEFFTVLRLNKVSTIYELKVTLDDDKKTAVLLDQITDVQWSAGVDPDTWQPSFNLRAKQFSGTAWTYSAAAELGLDAKTLKPGIVYAYAFNQGKLKKTVTNIIKDSGYKVVMDGITKGAIVMAGIGVVVAVAATIVAIYSTKAG